MLDKDLLLDLSDRMDVADDAIRRYFDNEDDFSEKDLLEVLDKVDLSIWTIRQEVEVNE